MIICYMAAICPHKYFSKMESEVSVAAYKFNRLLAQGFTSLANVQVRNIVPLSLLKRMERGELNQEIEEAGIQYVVFERNVVEKGYVKYTLEVLKRIREWKKEDDVVVVTDALGMVADAVSLLAHILYGVKTVAIITDLPQFVGNPQKIKEIIRYKINLMLMRRFQNYVLLTENMAEWVNRYRRPQCVVEGVCDWNSRQEIQDCDKYSKKVCMYAGSLHKEYGIDMLIAAFIKADVEDSELHIYGSGNYSSDIEEICEQYENILYFGQCSHDKILQEERKVSLLINPRPSNAEYTKYSFPSKTLEYMSSGTPVLMTRLPGMPPEYAEYVYLFEEETIDGYAEKIEEILVKDEELLRKGKSAKEFILSTRNNRVQALRIQKELKL